MGSVASDWVEIPTPCDSSIQLTLTQRLVAHGAQLRRQDRASAAAFSRVGDSQAKARVLL